MPFQPATAEDAPSRELFRLLAGGARPAAELASALGISQPTLSRTIRALAPSITSFRVTGRRTPLYGLLRPLPMGINPRQRIHRYLDQGQIRPFADVEFLAGGGTLERTSVQTTLYAGLPPYMAFAAPSGFLGRQLAQDVTRAQQLFPASLRDWGDGDRVAYLFTQGLNLPGNLVFGDLALQSEMELRAATPVPATYRPASGQASVRSDGAVFHIKWV